MTTIIPRDGREYSCDHCGHGEYHAWHIGPEAVGPYRGPEWVVADDEGRETLDCRFCDEPLEVED